MRLTATTIKTLAPGRHADGNGLYLYITDKGTRSWVLRIVVHGKRRDFGLGSYHLIGIKEARKQAQERRAELKSPTPPPPTAITAYAPTLREAADAVHQMRKHNLKPGRYSDEWLNPLAQHVFPTLGDMPINTITKRHVIDSLTPLWGTQPAIAKRIRQRLQLSFKWGMAQDFLATNPAGEAIDGALPTIKHRTHHHDALPYSDVQPALSLVRASTSQETTKLCLEFLVLTASRSKEATNATWNEIDLDHAIWTIPADRMKQSREHRVPLSTQAIAILRRARELNKASHFVFESPKKPGQPIGGLTLIKLLSTLPLHKRTTAHGFRTSFKAWSMEVANPNWHVSEAALSHTIGNSTVQAYARTDLFEQRRTLMQQWGDYLTS